MIYDIHQIYIHRGSDVAVFLGCGDSINRITKKEWSSISKCDTWSLNEWLYHPFIPKFYHLELKKDFDHWKERRKQKGTSYDNVIFICNKGKVNRYSEAIGKNQPFIYSYESRNWNAKRELITPDFKLHPRIITKAYSSSVTPMLDVMLRFGYKYIIFFGVDLYNSKYFWTDKQNIYGQVFQNTNKNYPVDHKHNTEPVKKYIADFNKMFAKPLGTKLCVGHEDTALREVLKLNDICKLVK